MSLPFVEQLLLEGDASTRYKLALAGFANPGRALQQELKRSPRAQALLRGWPGVHPYTKWNGAHWVLSTLADLGYPPGDRALNPLREHVLSWLLDPRRLRPRTKADEPYLAPIVTVQGRVRIHASIEGNALFALHALGLADRRADALARRLVETQWADGGWNCDRAPDASHASFEETLLPLRGLTWHARARQDAAAAEAARRAAEHLLERRLFRRRTSGTVIDPKFVALHYPPYWHYDLLAALKVMAEAGRLGDPRCAEALARLRSKQHDDGGFAAEARFWSGKSGRGRSSPVSWGPAGTHHSNEFVTADALWVLEQARRAVRAATARGAA